MKEELLMKLIDKLISSESVSIETEKRMIGDYVIVRCHDAGVHAGILVNYNGREVVLKESRRLWYFKCKSGHSLSGVAIHGIADASKIAGEVKEIVLTESCEIISTTKESEESIRNANEYNP